MKLSEEHNAVALDASGSVKYNWNGIDIVEPQRQQESISRKVTL
jgi:hypothetical protein